MVTRQVSVSFHLPLCLLKLPIAKAIEYMIVDALLAAEPYLNFARHIFDPKRYLHLTDDIRVRIEASEGPVRSLSPAIFLVAHSSLPQELKPARDILCRIHKRDLYRMVDWKVFPWAFQYDCRQIFTPERIVRAAQADEREHAAGERALLDALRPEHVVVDISMMHYGMKDKNPLDTVSFYSKLNANSESPHARGVYRRYFNKCVNGPQHLRRRSRTMSRCLCPLSLARSSCGSTLERLGASPIPSPLLHT